MTRKTPVDLAKRCLLVVEGISAFDRPVGVTELAGRVGLAKATIHRICQSLLSAGFLSQDDHTRGYLVGRRLYGLASRVVAGMDLAAAARPVLRDLSQAAGGNAVLALLSDDRLDLVVVAEQGGAQPLASRSILGRTFPVDGMLAGPACLAAMSPQQRDQVSRQLERKHGRRRSGSDSSRLARDVLLASRNGYHLGQAGLGRGVYCLCCCVVDSKDRPTGAVSLLLRAARKRDIDLPRLSGLCIEAGRSISTLLGACRGQ